MDKVKIHETAIVDTGAEIGEGHVFGIGPMYALVQRLGKTFL